MAVEIAFARITISGPNGQEEMTQLLEALAAGGGQVTICHSYITTEEAEIRRLEREATDE